MAATHCHHVMDVFESLGVALHQVIRALVRRKHRFIRGKLEADENIVLSVYRMLTVTLTCSHSYHGTYVLTYLYTLVHL